MFKLLIRRKILCHFVLSFLKKKNVFIVSCSTVNFLCKARDQLEIYGILMLNMSFFLGVLFLYIQGFLILGLLCQRKQKKCFHQKILKT